MDTRIGIIPIPVFVILFALLAGFTYTGDIKGEISMMIAVLVIGGFTCAEIGKRIPILRNIGSAAIFATFIPSALAYYKLIPPQIEKSIIEFTKYTNFLYLFIACIIVGSILGMDRKVLVKGFVKIFVPLALGSIAAGSVGTLVGTMLGLGAHHSFFYVVLPIMAGGVGEGAIPLSIGYSEILHQPQGDVFAQILPPIMLGSLTAIILSGILNYVGKRYPSLTGEGRLQPAEHDDMDPAKEEVASETGGPMDGSTVAAAGLAAITLYLLGVMCHRLFGLPAPVAMLFLAVLAKLTSAVSPHLQQGGLRGLQVLFHRGHLSAAVRHRRLADAVGQTGRGIQRPEHDHDLQHRRHVDGDRRGGRPVSQHVPDRVGDHQRLSQRAGRHRRRRDPDRRKPDAADAVRPDRDADRRRDHRDDRADHTVAHLLAERTEVAISLSNPGIVQALPRSG